MQAKDRKSRTLQFLAGIPALIALAGGTLALNGNNSRSNQLDWCRNTARVAVDNSDYQTASVCYARLLQADPHDRELAFNLAQSLQALGQHESAQSLMTQLTSVGSGFAPAEIWLAQQIIVDPNSSDESLQSAAGHAERALQLQPDDPTTNYWAALLYARQHRWTEVEPAAAKVHDQIRMLCQHLSEIAKAQGNVAAMQRWSREPQR